MIAFLLMCTWEAVKFICGMMCALLKCFMYLAFSPFLLIWYIIKAICH